MVSSKQIDPTRTGAIRDRFVRDMKRRFAWLTKQVQETLISSGLVVNHVRQGIVTNRGFEFTADADKLQRFQEWLKKRVDEGVLGVTSDLDQSAPWLSPYISSSYKQGIIRAWKDTHPDDGVNHQFVSQLFGGPIGTKQIEDLSTRAFDGLKDVTADMSDSISEVLADGLANGLDAEKIGRNLAQEIEINSNRAETIARTEITHSFVEAQLDSFEQLGVKGVGVDVEWVTAGDDAVCPECDGMEGNVYSIDEARGMIPAHPNCRCAFVPNVER